MKGLILFINLLLVSAGLSAQVVVNAKIDNMQLLVGEQAKLSLEVVCDANQRVEMPPFKAGMEVLPNVEVVKVSPVDTASLNAGKRKQYRQDYLLTAWDSALYYLPPLPVTVDDSLYESKSLAMKVFTVDVDTLNYNKYFDIKDVMPAPFSYDDWKWVTAVGLLNAVLAVCFILLLIALITGKPLIRIRKRKPKEPAHQVALREIERIKEERTWAREGSKEYYTQLTDTLRTYIKERYGFNALEMTSTEIIERLMQEDNPGALNELNGLFQTADLVKFAKHETQINENDANLLTALEYVQQTKREVDPKEEEKEEELTPEVKRSRVNRISLYVTIVVVGLAIVVASGWLVYRLRDLLM